MGQLTSVPLVTLSLLPLLSGTIPSEIGQMDGLRTLTMTSLPLLSGTMPTYVSTFSVIRVVKSGDAERSEDLLILHG